MANSGDPLKGQLTQGHATPTPVTARSTGGVGAPPVLKSERQGSYKHSEMEVFFISLKI